jgi:DNA-binding transcriptional ArsR family regulator
MLAVTARPAAGAMPAPGYDLDEVVEASTPQQLRALGGETRQEILGLLAEQAASITMLADALAMPRGTVGHHVKVLADAGLIRVVSTRKVRALTEKLYGRVARTYLLTGVHGESEPFAMLSRAMRECRLEPAATLPMFTLRHARIPAARAEEFAARVVDLAVEFAGQERGGTTTYGFVAGVYPTHRRGFTEKEST